MAKTWKVGHTLKMGRTLENWVTLRKVGHTLSKQDLTWKNGYTWKNQAL